VKKIYIERVGNISTIYKIWSEKNPLLLLPNSGSGLKSGFCNIKSVTEVVTFAKKLLPIPLPSSH